MIPTDTVTGHAFIPQWRTGEAAPPRYFLRGASVIERAQLEAELSGEYDAGRVYGFETVDAFRSGLATLLAADPGLHRLLDLLEQEVEGTILMGEDRQLLITARGVVAQHWPQYRELVAQQERRREIAPIVIFRRFCVGWENVLDRAKASVAFDIGTDRLIPDHVLSRIDPLEMKAAGNFGYSLLYGAADAQNFPQPSKSDDDQTTSGNAPSTGDGKSASIAGQTIPD